MALEQEGDIVFPPLIRYPSLDFKEGQVIGAKGLLPETAHGAEGHGELRR